MIKYKFSRHNALFAQTLRERVYGYFADNQLERNGDHRMVWKSVVAYSLYLVPFSLVLFGGFTDLKVLFFLWLVMGLGKVFIGTSVMHDALHGSYSSKKWINTFFGASAWMVGANPKMWQIQHNVLHHTYTNIEHADEDISPRFVLRFTPHQERRWFHRFQHLYASFFYSLSIILWVTIKDFRKLVDYRNEGLVKKGKESKVLLTKIILHKVLYFTVFLVLPALMLPFSFGMVLLMYLTMEAATGLLLTLIFQSAHIMPEANFIEQEEEQIEEDWVIHQLMTTTNFGRTNKLLFWFTGGLNFQVEHHLFPHICHIHYPKIADIVRSTAREFGLPYHEIRSFRQALLKHFEMLQMLGSSDQVKPKRVLA